MDTVWSSEPVQIMSITFNAAEYDSMGVLGQAVEDFVKKHNVITRDVQFVSHGGVESMVLYYEANTTVRPVEQEKAIQAVFNWLSIVAREKPPEEVIIQPEQIRALRMDAHHSALLDRLLSGKQALLVSPPLSFNQPWYGLIENQHATATQVELVQREEAQVVMIDQYAWTLERLVGENDYIVSYPNDKSAWWRVTKNTEEKFWVIKRLLKWPLD